MHALTAEELGWATKQVALIVGAVEDDARPLAEFLAAVESAHELQSQVLDMLGESPLALEFGSALISKRFPPEPSPAAKVVAKPTSEPAQMQSGPQQQQRQQGEQAEQPQKSQRQLRREKQMQREADEKRRRQANRRRAKCECQGSEHLLLTNCLTCGRIVCEHEGPGPCMFCGSDVQSPDQQLQQHMRRLLHREENPAGQEDESKKQPKAKPKAAGNSYSAKVAGGPTAAPRAGNLLWDEDEAVAASATTSDGQTQQRQQQQGQRPAEVSEAEYLHLAFQALGIDEATASADAIAGAEAWARATRRKERLLGYDRTAAQRTRLIDQASDFDPDAISKWMSPEEKAQAEARSAARAQAGADRASRLRSGLRVLRVDLATGSVDLQRPDAHEDDEPAAYQPPLPETVAAASAAAHPRGAATGAFAHNPLLKDAAEPRFVLPAKDKGKGKGKGKDQAQGQGGEVGRHKKPVADASLLATQRRMLRIQTDLLGEELAF